MKLLKLMKDGGPESRVWGFFFIEWKRFFSVVLLHFKDGSREAYHSHAFNALSWLLRGKLVEDRLLEKRSGFTRNFIRVFTPSFIPIWTARTNMHKVSSAGDSWALTFRGPWAENWKEYLPDVDEWRTLAHGRKVIEGGMGYPRANQADGTTLPPPFDA